MKKVLDTSKLIIIPGLLALCLTGLIWAVRTQSIQDAQLTHLGRIHEKEITDLKYQLEKVVSEQRQFRLEVVGLGTPLAKRVELIDERLVALTDRFNLLEGRLQRPGIDFERNNKRK